VTETVSDGTLYVPTDVVGRQFYGDHETIWPLPTTEADGSVVPGEEAAGSATSPLSLFSADGLLDELNDRIFVAVVAPAALAETRPWGVAADGARLVSETTWSTFAAARFALDCADHVLAMSNHDTVRLKSGESLLDVVGAAKRWLADADAAEAGLLGRVSRIAIARRLRRSSDRVAALAFGRTVADEAVDLDAMDDPAWEAIATTRDAVLAAVDAVRHQTFPQLVERESARYEEDLANASHVSPEPEPIVTPWGTFLVGAPGGIVPASVAARDAAERARQAVGDAAGRDAASAERAWQRDRLAAALRDAPA
jgi:hypothetical protein